MVFQKILNKLNVLGYCKKYGLSPWQCPQFLFLVMGIVIICSELTAYYVGNRYISNPQIVLLIVLTLTCFLLIISFSIVKGFDNLAEANRMKSEFVSVVSHQLRSPLSNLSWTIDLLMSGKVGKIQSEQVEYFKILKENNGRMKDLVSNLLIVSRLQSASLIFKNSFFQLESLINESVKSFGPYIKASNVEFEFFAEENLLPVFADQDQIRMVVENLLDNAIRYTKSRGKVTVRLKKAGKNIRFEITDDGVGIPKSDQKYLFQKFFRSENAMRHQTQGSGLGLYIAKSIVEKSKGKIGFESEENKKTTFWFTLPTSV